MPPLLTLWDPRLSILLWINSTNRRIKETSKAREQSWFKGIFEDSMVVQSLKRDALDEDTNHSKKKKENFKCTL